MDLKYFWELGADTIRDRCILLDVDGTLVVTSESHAHPGVQDTVNRLKEHNDVFLFSNNALDHVRNIEMAQKLSLPYVATLWRKPMPMVVHAIPNTKKLPLLIVGDLFLTDGLLAFFTRSHFIRVRRCIAPHEARARWLMLYWLDDTLAAFFMPRLFPLSKK